MIRRIIGFILCVIIGMMLLIKKNIWAEGIEFTVRFIDHDGSLISENMYSLGDEIIFPQAPSDYTDGDYSYSFEYWENTENGRRVATTEDITGGLLMSVFTIKAVYTPSLVYWRDYTVSIPADISMEYRDGKFYGGFDATVELHSNHPMCEVWLWNNGGFSLFGDNTGEEIRGACTIGQTTFACQGERDVYYETHIDLETGEAYTADTYSGVLEIEIGCNLVSGGP